MCGSPHPPQLLALSNDHIYSTNTTNDNERNCAIEDFGILLIDIEKPFSLLEHVKLAPTLVLELLDSSATTAPRRSPDPCRSVSPSLALESNAHERPRTCSPTIFLLVHPSTPTDIQCPSTPPKVTSTYCPPLPCKPVVAVQQPTSRIPPIPLIRVNSHPI